MTPFIWQKIGASLIGRKRAWLKNQWKKPKNRFFGLISWNFQYYIKNRITCDTLPWTVLLVQISKESDRIWGSYGQKTTQKQPKIQLSAATKTFESLQLGSHKCYTNETYHNYVSSWDLSLGQNFGRNSIGVRERDWKTSEKEPKN